MSATSRPLLILAALAIVALVLRTSIARQPPFDFAVMRQHHSALIAANEFYKYRPGAVPDWRRRVAADYVAQATIPEPVVIERVAALSYGLAGREDVTWPRAISGVLWIAGAILLFAAVRNWSSGAAGTVAVAVYAFLPYTFRASISLQPDPLAVMLTCAALFALSRAKTDAPAVLLAAITAAAAILVRPMTACFLLPAALALMWQARQGRVPVGRIALYSLVSILPVLAYLGWRLSVDPSYVTRVSGTFAPALLLDVGFYRGWARNIWMAFGPVIFAIAGLGVLLAPRGPLRAAVRGMWLGYVVYGVFFNLHISTHPYYQTLAVPMVACSVAAVYHRITSGQVVPSLWPAPVLAASLLAASLWQGVFLAPVGASRVSDYQAIGVAVDHSDRVVFLSEDWGTPLRYHGGVAGRYWPTRFEIQMYRPLGTGGLSDQDAASRWQMTSTAVGGAHYFVVTNMAELSRQPDLQRLLAERFTLIKESTNYLVYEALQ